MNVDLASEHGCEYRPNLLIDPVVYFEMAEELLAPLKKKVVVAYSAMLAFDLLLL